MAELKDTIIIGDLAVTGALESPVLAGTPTAPTAATATNTTQIATTAFVKAQGYAPIASPNFSGTPKISNSKILTAANFSFDSATSTLTITT